jgi:hypothetical protein
MPKSRRERAPRAQSPIINEQQRGSFSLDEFAARHGIARATLYLLWRRGEGPRFFHCGSRRLISVEADREWVRAREQAAGIA